MEYKIHNLRFDDLIMRDMGQDYISLNFDIEMNGTWYWHHVPFEELWEFAKQKEMPESKYFDNIRNNIKGFGPKHSKMFDALLEEQFDFMPLLKLYLDNDFEKHGVDFMEYRRNKSPEEVTQKDIEEAKEIEKIAEDLKTTALSMRDFNLRHTELEDNLLEFLNNETLRLFPEIFNSKKEHIKELEEILYSWDLRDLAEKIVNLAHKAYDDEEE